MFNLLFIIRQIHQFLIIKEIILSNAQQHNDICDYIQYRGQQSCAIIS